MLEMRNASFRPDPAGHAPDVAHPGDALLDQAGYELWLLPPEPRDGVERIVHGLSLAAGVVALVIGGGMLWAIL